LSVKPISQSQANAWRCSMNVTGHGRGGDVEDQGRSVTMPR
jgi:hypothetical protein